MGSRAGCVLAIGLAALVSVGPASAAWSPSENLMVCGGTGNQDHPAIASDGQRGAIIAWFDSRSGNWEIYAQHVLASGDVDPVWTAANGNANGTLLRHAVESYQPYWTVVIVSDGAGGAIVAWTDYRNGTKTGDIYAQHVLASGVVDPAWSSANGNPDGTALCTAPNDQLLPAIVSDGAGGAIATWSDSRSGTPDVYAQHVLASGRVDPAWSAVNGNANGTALCLAAGDQVAPTIVSDGAGGAIVTWSDRRNGYYDRDIYAQHVLASGVVDPAWTAANGNANGTTLCHLAGYRDYPTIASDGAGGAIVTWDDDRSGNEDVYAQRVLASGTVDPAWTAANGNANGTLLCNAANDQLFPVLVSDGSGGAIVTWQDYRTGPTNDIYAQHVLASGIVDPAWSAANGNANGTPLCRAANYQYLPGIVPDGAGGALVTWVDYRSGVYATDIYAQHVLASGLVDPAWTAAVGNADGRPVCTAPGEQSAVAITSAGAGGAIVTWQDERNPAVGYDVYAQHVGVELCAGGETPPTADFVAAPTSGAQPLLVRFTDQSIAGSRPISTWHWDFGDGTSSPDQNPTHTYTAYCPHPFTVSLTVDAGGCANTLTRANYITLVGAPPAPTFWPPPEDGATGVPTNLTLRWHALSCATSYRLQVATNPTFSTTVVDQAGITGSSYDVSLAGNTLYYWRVNASNATGTGPYEYTHSFTTGPAPPAAPTLVAPTNGANGVPTSAGLMWIPVSGAASYGLQVSTTTSFSAPVVNQSGIGGTSFLVSLDIGTQYYWRVNASNSAGPGPYSSVWSFTTTSAGRPPAPALVFPASGATGVPTNPTFRWNPVAGATSYRLEVCSNPSFVGGFDGLGIQETSYAIGLGEFTTFYWRVSAADSTGLGPFSAVWSFTTGANRPPAPTLVSPVNGSTLYTSHPTLCWHAASNAVSYHLQIFTDYTYSTSVVDQSDLPDTSYTGSLPDSNLYVWRVNAVYSDGPGLSSSTWSFAIYTRAPSAPTLASPPDGARGVARAPALSWNAVDGGMTYHLQISSTRSFADTLLDRPGLLETTHAELLADTTLYYWRVNASNPLGTSTYSSVWSFTTTAGHPAEGGVPRRIPADDARSSPPSPGALCFALPGTWPNPVSANLTVSFSLPSASAATLEVIDVSGRKVLARSIGALGIGNHVVSFDDAGQLSDGVYMLRLTQEGRSASIPIVILH